MALNSGGSSCAVPFDSVKSPWSQKYDCPMRHAPFRCWMVSLGVVVQVKRGSGVIEFRRLISRWLGFAFSLALSLWVAGVPKDRYRPKTAKPDMIWGTISGAVNVADAYFHYR
jgi:hypothetical protein